MLRFIVIMLMLGAAAAAGAWFVPEGLLRNLMSFAAAIAGLILLGAVAIALLQHFSPSESADESPGT